MECSRILIRGDALALPFAAAKYPPGCDDFPIRIYSESHSPLAEIHRVLVDDGMAVMLPLAWITGRKPLERVVAWLNRITGESPEWHEQSLEPLKKAGFKVDWEMIDFGSSKILVIRMIKSTSSGAGLPVVCKCDIVVKCRVWKLKLAVAKINKYATSESGDSVEVVERPNGGISVVMADGQSSRQRRQTGIITRSPESNLVII